MLFTLVTLATVVLAACGDGGRPTNEGADVRRAVCEAWRAAADGRTDEARDAFGDAHQALHDLAAATEARDRRAAAELLEAKQRVEASAAATPAEYRALAAAVEQALGATGDVRADRVECSDG